MSFSDLTRCRRAGLLLECHSRPRTTLCENVAKDGDWLCTRTIRSSSARSNWPEPPPPPSPVLQIGVTVKEPVRRSRILVRRISNSVTECPRNENAGGYLLAHENIHWKLVPGKPACAECWRYRASCLRSRAQPSSHLSLHPSSRRRPRQLLHGRKPRRSPREK